MFDIFKREVFENKVSLAGISISSHQYRHPLCGFFVVIAAFSNGTFDDFALAFERLAKQCLIGLNNAGERFRIEIVRKFQEAVAPVK